LRVEHASTNLERGTGAGLTSSESGGTDEERAKRAILERHTHAHRGVDADRLPIANLTPDLIQTSVFQGRAAKVARPFSFCTYDIGLELSAIDGGNRLAPNRRSLQTGKTGACVGL
jgi:hypothetical protein